MGSKLNKQAASELESTEKTHFSEYTQKPMKDNLYEHFPDYTEQNEDLQISQPTIQTPLTTSSIPDKHKSSKHIQKYQMNEEHSLYLVTTNGNGTFKIILNKEYFGDIGE